MSSFARKILISLLILLGGLRVSAQTTQKGIVVEMSSQDRPIAGAEIKVTGASPTDSDQEGRFVLHFTSSLQGDPVMMNEVYKKGFRIVNLEKLASWNISSTSELKIVLGQTEVIDALRKKYYAIGESSNEREYKKSLEQLMKLKKQNILSQIEYEQKIDSLSKTKVDLQKRLDLYALKFAYINRDELDETELQAMTLLDRGDIYGAIQLYENMKLDSTMMMKLAGKRETDKDLKLVSPSLVNHFRLLKQAKDTVACDSIAKLVYEVSIDIKERLEAVEWIFFRDKIDTATDMYSLLVKETKTTQEIESVEKSFKKVLGEIKLTVEFKNKAKRISDRITSRKKWISIKEKSRYT